MREKDLKKRTKRLGLEILRFAGKLPKGMEYQMIRRQLIRAAASVGANYRAAYRSRSKKDFIARLGVVAEESDEVQYWLELLEELRGAAHPQLNRLKKEADELVAIMVSSINTARSRT